MGLIAAFGPIWILSVAGYLARRYRVLADNGAEVLGQFLFHIAIPAALFVTLGKTPLSGFALRPLAAFAASTAIVIGAGWYCAGRWFGRTSGERAIWGMASGYVNSANLGIPIALQVIAASGLGVIASATGFHAPVVLRATLNLLGAAAVPTALVALGASLYRERSAQAEGNEDITGGPRRLAVIEMSVITVLKLVVQPAIAFAVGAFALRLPHAQLLAVVICAGLPTAQNAFVYAQHYRTAEALAGRAILITTTLSMATLFITPLA